MPYEPKDAEYLKMIPGSATYDEIKEYVLKKYNVKVSSLYVTQVNNRGIPYVEEKGYGI